MPCRIMVMDADGTRVTSTLGRHRANDQQEDQHVHQCTGAMHGSPCSSSRAARAAFCEQAHATQQQSRRITIKEGSALQCQLKAPNVICDEGNVPPLEDLM